MLASARCPLHPCPLYPRPKQAQRGSAWRCPLSLVNPWRVQTPDAAQDTLPDEVRMAKRTGRLHSALARCY